MEQHVAGLTDRRYEGTIVRYLVEKGYGFIRCQELREKFPERDIFLHQKQLGNFKEGDSVSFGILMNRDGKPIATELAYLNGSSPQQNIQQDQFGMQQSMQYGHQQYGNSQYGQPYGNQQYDQYGQYQPQYSGYGMQQSMPQGMQAISGGQQQSVGDSGHWPQAPQEEESTHEVEVPKDLVSQFEGGRLQQLKYRAGGSIQVTFQTKVDVTNPVAVVKGPKVQASLGVILLMQELCDLIHIPE